MTRGVRVRVPVKSRFFFFPRRPDRLWGSPSLLSNGYRGSFPRDKPAGALQLVPRSRKYGSIHPLPRTPSWRSAKLIKHRDNFTFYIAGYLWRQHPRGVFEMYPVRIPLGLLANMTFLFFLVCWSWGSDKGDYEEYGLMGLMQCRKGEISTFLKNISPPSLGTKIKPCSTCHLFLAGFLTFQSWKQRCSSEMSGLQGVTIQMPQFPCLSLNECTNIVLKYVLIVSFQSLIHNWLSFSNCIRIR
jgi:hypothetical protein